MRKNAHKTQTTRRVVAILLFMGMAFTAKAQVLMIDADENYRDLEDPRCSQACPQISVWVWTITCPMVTACCCLLLWVEPTW